MNTIVFMRPMRFAIAPAKMFVEALRKKVRERRVLRVVAWIENLRVR